MTGPEGPTKNEGNEEDDLEVPEEVQKMHEAIGAGWDNTKKNYEDPEKLLLDAVFESRRQIDGIPAFSQRSRELLQDALVHVQHEILPTLPESIRTVQYFNQIGGAKNLVLMKTLEEAAEHVTTLKEFDEMLRQGTYLFWHVPSDHVYQDTQRRLNEQK